MLPSPAFREHGHYDVSAPMQGASSLGRQRPKDSNIVRQATFLVGLAAMGTKAISGLVTGRRRGRLTTTHSSTPEKPTDESGVLHPVAPQFLSGIPRDTMRFALGLGIIISWQLVGLNLFRWTKLLSPSLKLKNHLGGYTTSGSIFYALAGIILILLRFQPSWLVQPRKYAWFVLMRAFAASGCPSWFREHAARTLGHSVDNMSTAVQMTLAGKLILRALPLVLDMSGYVIPVRDFFGVTGHVRMSATLLAKVNEVCAHVLSRVFAVATSMIILRTFLELKDPPLRRDKNPMPSKVEKALEGTSAVWLPIVGFIVWRRSAKQRSLRMRLQLFDKVLTCVAVVLAGIPVLNLLNLRVQTVLAVGGVGGLAIGLALQNLAQNLISGMLIFVNSSVCESLEVELQQSKASGVVSKVGWFNTRVNGYDGLQILVPNRTVLDGIVIDKSNKLFRKLDTEFLVTIEDKASLKSIVTAVQQALESTASVLQTEEVQKLKRRHDGNIKAYAPQCVFEGWSDLGAKLRVRAFFPGSLTNDAFWDVRSRLLLDVDETIRSNGGRIGYCNAVGEERGSTHGSASDAFGGVVVPTSDSRLPPSVGTTTKNSTSAL
mmetsp:Transcript_36775/g.84685  ORF Transcript_36775/g.84685 Transcript_36775/m.84685 type:complete len:603 (-) Transcript_36775:104-1912(-)